MRRWLIGALLVVPFAQSQAETVIVYGGSPAGLAAAWTAARQGQSVGLYEPTDQIGGDLISVSTVDPDGGPLTGFYGAYAAKVQAKYSAWTSIASGQVLTAEPQFARSSITDLLGAIPPPGSITVHHYCRFSYATLSGGQIQSLTFTPQGPAGTTSPDCTSTTPPVTGKVFIDASWGEVTNWLCQNNYITCAIGKQHGSGSSYWTSTLLSSITVQNATWSTAVKKYPGGVPTSPTKIDAAAAGGAPAPAPNYTPISTSKFPSVLVPNCTTFFTLPPPPTGSPYGWEGELGYRYTPDFYNAAYKQFDPGPEHPTQPCQPAYIHSKGGLNWTPLNDVSAVGNVVDPINNPTPKPAMTADDMFRMTSSPASAIACYAKALTLGVLYYLRTSGANPAELWSVSNDGDYTTGYTGQSQNSCFPASSQPVYAAMEQLLPPFPYLREGVRGYGAYFMTGQDMYRTGAGIPAAHFPTAVATGGYASDFHQSLTDGVCLDTNTIETGDAYQALSVQGNYQIPYESFFTASVPNLVFAGLTLSQTRVANSSSRVHSTQMRTGDAAGMISALAIAKSTTPNLLSPFDVQAALAKAGGAVSPYVFQDVPASSSYSPAVQVVSANQFMTGYGSSSVANVAVGMVATQSSTYPGGSNCPPLLPSCTSAASAVDGNTDGSFYDGSLSTTNNDANAWWQVDLGSPTNISSVVIWNRTDCCGDRLGDYWVFVSNTPFLSTDTPTTLSGRAGTVGMHLTAAPNPSAAIAFPSGTQGRYVRVQLSGTNYLSLAEVQVIPMVSNLALSKTARQSSSYVADPPPPPPQPPHPCTPPPPNTKNAALAVDNNTDGGFFDNSVSTTNNDANAWWEVDLGTPASLGSITIWNRTDCCGDRLSDFWVFVSDTPFADTDTPSTLAGRAGTYSIHEQITNGPNPSVTIPFSSMSCTSRCGLGLSRYVRVQLTGANYLSLAEVQVFGTTAFHVDAPITRSQAAMAIANRFAWSLKDRSTRANPASQPPYIFADMPQSDPGLASAEWMLATGLTGGCGGNNFCPTQQLTREQAAVFLVKGLQLPLAQGGIGLQLSSCPNTIPDVPQSDPSCAYVASAIANGVLSLAPDGVNFHPNSTITQGDFAVALARTVSMAAPYFTGPQLP